MGVSVEGTTSARVVGEATQNIFSFGNKASDKRIPSSDLPASACPETSLAIVRDRWPQTLGLAGVGMSRGVPLLPSGGGHRGGTSGQPQPGSFTPRCSWFPPCPSWLLVPFDNSEGGNGSLRP